MESRFLKVFLYNIPIVYVCVCNVFKFISDFVNLGSHLLISWTKVLTVLFIFSNN